MFLVRYYRPGESDPFFADDHDEPPLPEIGDGLIWGDGTRYRVVDRWLSFDHHGHFEEAWHVFLEPVEAGGRDDRPGRLVPRYFGVETPLQRALHGATEELEEEWRREQAEQPPESYLLRRGVQNGH